MCNQLLPPPYPMATPTADEFRQIQKKAVEAQMDIAKHAEKKAIDDQYDVRRMERLEEYRALRSMATLVVSYRCDGRFVYGFDEEGIRRTTKEVFPNCSRIIARKLKTPNEACSVISISADFGSQNIRFFLDCNVETVSKTFEKALIQHHVSINVSRRNRDEVLCQVLSLLLKDASSEVIAEHPGWNKDENGCFFLVGEDELTILEVQRNVY